MDLFVPIDGYLLTPLQNVIPSRIEFGKNVYRMHSHQTEGLPAVSYSIVDGGQIEKALIAKFSILTYSIVVFYSLNCCSGIQQPLSSLSNDQYTGDYAYQSLWLSSPSIFKINDKTEFDDCVKNYIIFCLHSMQPC